MTSKLDLVEKKIEEIVGELTRGVIERRLQAFGASRDTVTDKQLLEIIEDIRKKVLENFLGPELSASVADQLKGVVGAD